MSEFLLWIAVLSLIAKVMGLSKRVRILESGRPQLVLEPKLDVTAPLIAPPPLPVEPEPAAMPIQEAPLENAQPEPHPDPHSDSVSQPLSDPVSEPEPAKPAVDWEALLGGNLLNKAGVLLLIVGIALFLGYSLRELGPGGRIGIGILSSLVLMGAGMFAEKRDGYQMFGRGLLGGGWAGLYFTTFAAYAIPAAQVIASPVLGTLLLGCVSAAMIAHSLRYRSETVTGMAYLLSFLTLGISGAPTLAIIATVPLAASVIYIAYRFNWTRLIVAGLPIAYAVFFLQSQGMTHAQPQLLKLMLLTYWIVFEAAEVMRPSGSRLPFLLNAICFSFLAWGSPALAACAYAASTAMRIYFKREYRGALTALAFLCGSAIVQHTRGLTEAICLLVEAELLFLAGVRYNQRFIRWLGAAAFTAGVVNLLGNGLFTQPQSWTIATSMTAVVMYANRFLHRGSWGYSWVGTALAVIVLGAKTSDAWHGVAWLALGGVLAEAHKRFGLRDLKWQAALVGGLAAIALAAVNAIGVDQPSPLPWEPQLVATLMLFAGAMRSSFATPACTAGAAMAAVLIWNVLPAPMVALGWAALSLALFETGWRRQGEAMALAAFGRLFYANFDVEGRLLTTTPVIALQYYLFYRGSRWFVYTGAIAAATLIRFEAGRLFALVGWGIMFVICQYIGARRESRDFRIQAYLLAAVTFVHCWMTNFYEPAVLHRVWTAAAVIASLFTAHLVSRRDQETFARPLFSTLGSALLSVLLFHEVSGKLLTMAWAGQGALLLAAGFGIRERHVRLTGLALLTACIAKLFFYDFATLETPYRIASFLVLGVLLIAGSWVYTRFRKQLEGVL